MELFEKASIFGSRRVNERLAVYLNFLDHILCEQLNQVDRESRNDNEISEGQGIVSHYNKHFYQVHCSFGKTSFYVKGYIRKQAKMRSEKS